jgi:hypothetical protein
VDANARAEGVAIDETYLYVLDHIDRRLYRYRRDGMGPVDASRGPGTGRRKRDARPLRRRSAARFVRRRRCQPQ